VKNDQLEHLCELLDIMHVEHNTIGANFENVRVGGMTWFVRIDAQQRLRAECISPMTLNDVTGIIRNSREPMYAQCNCDGVGDVEVTCPSCGVEISYSEVPLPGYCQCCGQALMYGDDGRRFDVSSPKDVSIRDIVSAWLARHGFHGLVNPDAECGCDLRDLMVCGEPDERRCLPGYRHDCATCDAGCWRAATAKPDEYMMDGSKDGCECRELEDCRDVD